LYSRLRGFSGLTHSRPTILFMRWAASLQLPVDLLVFRMLLFRCGSFSSYFALIILCKSSITTCHWAWCWEPECLNMGVATEPLGAFFLLNLYFDSTFYMLSQVSLDNSRNSGVFRGRCVLFYRGAQLGTVTCDHAELIGPCGDTSTSLHLVRILKALTLFSI
jgi:hypothetical protein